MDVWEVLGAEDSSEMERSRAGVSVLIGAK